MAYSRGKIRGITIEIGGDTTQFQKAMSNVDGVLKDTQSKLKDIDRLLKLDPKNTELLRQKQEALDKALGNTKTRLDVLNEALSQAKLNNAPKEEIDALNREIVETEQKLKSAEKEAKNFGSVFSQQLKAVGGEMKEVGGKIADTGKDLSMKLTAPLVAVGTIGISYNANLEKLQAMFTTLTGSAEEADRVIGQIQEDASRTPFDSSSLIQANQLLMSAGVSADDSRKTILALGDAVAATGGGDAELERMAQNLQQIRNVGKASSQDIKQFANAGINIYGLLADTMGKNVDEIKDMEISYDDLSEALQKASSEGGAYSGAMEKQANTLTGAINSTKASLQKLLGDITRSAMPIITKLVQNVKNVIDRFSQLDDKQKKMILTIAAVVAAIGPAIVIIGKIISLVGTLISVIGMLFTPLGGIVVAITAAIAAGVLLWQNWDTIKQKATELWSNLTGTFAKIKDAVVGKISEMASGVSMWFNNIKATATSIFESVRSTIAEKIESARSAVSSAIEKIKGLFNFSWSLPNIRLPHFRVNGGKWPYGLGGEGYLPSIGIDWYAKAMKKGMILNNPTIFGMMNGKLLGGGENGSETIVGTNNLMSMIQSAVGNASPTINMTINGGSISANELAGVVISRLKTEIIRNNNRW